MPKAVEEIGASVFRVVLGRSQYARETKYVVADSMDEAEAAARAARLSRLQADLFVQLVEWLGPAVLAPMPKRKGKR